MSTDLRADEADPATAPEGLAEDDLPSHSARPAFIAFVGAEIAGLVMYLFMGRAMWFYGDEWKVLSSRGLPDMFRQHGGHLIALPFAVYRLQYFLFGLRTYMPYLALVVVLHLAVAALLRVIMRRAGVGPWLATAAACLYIFFGSGSQNTLWAFQITFVGAVAFGLLQLLLADHSGPLDRRDWLGLGCGLLAIACAGVAVTMIAIVGIAALIRGRWRAALFHTVPLGLLWGLWTLRFAAQPPFVTTPRVLLDWDRIGLGATFRSLGYVAPVGWALAAMLIAGLVLVLRRWDTAQRARVAAPLAMLAGLFLFMTITGASRAVLGLQAATASRYLDVTAVLVLPALAVAADALARRHRMLLAVALALLVFGIPGNIAAVRRNVPPTGYFHRVSPTDDVAPAHVTRDARARIRSSRTEPSADGHHLVAARRHRAPAVFRNPGRRPHESGGRISCDYRSTSRRAHRDRVADLSTNPFS